VEAPSVLPISLSTTQAHLVQPDGSQQVLRQSVWGLSFDEHSHVNCGQGRVR